MSKRSKSIKNTKKKLIVICLLIFAIPFVAVLARYVLDLYKDFFTKTEEFYFYSDRLKEDKPVYQLENWSGEENYEIEINMSSKKNNLVFAPYDITYEIECTAWSDNILVHLSKSSGIIRESTGSDMFTLMITPNSITPLKTGDVAWVEITATSTSHFDKELSARFNLVVGKEGVSYQIVDAPYRPYAELIITNTLFDTPTTIQMSFNPNELILDMTNENYLNATNETKTAIGAYEYINGMTFRVAALTSTKVRVYKVDRSQDYTYPKGNNEPIMQVNII